MNREERAVKSVYYFRSRISYHIEPGLVGSYLPLLRTLNPYLTPSPGIESQDPLIIEKAEELTANETNPYYKAKKIFEFINRHMRYAEKEGDPANRGASEALKTGVGVCEDYANLMAALLRAAGIPGRAVAGWRGQVDNQLTVMDESGSNLRAISGWSIIFPVMDGSRRSTYSYLNNGIPTVDYRRLTGFQNCVMPSTVSPEEPAAPIPITGKS